MSRRLRRWSIGVASLCAVGLLVWHFQSEIIGRGAEWYLRRVASREASSGALDARRGVVGNMHRLLMMPPPPDAMVPELFEVVTQLSRRTATGDVSLAWGAYLYTAYVRDLLRDRPDGSPVRDAAEVTAELEKTLRFFSIQRRPDAQGVRVGDLLGNSDGTYTLEEIERADREGRALPLK